MTLLVILFAGCDNTSKEEELLDTLLLVGRNVLQFGRLAAVMRQYVILSVHIRRVCVLVHLAALCDWQHEQLVCTTRLSAAGRGAPWHGMEVTHDYGQTVFTAARHCEMLSCPWFLQPLMHIQPHKCMRVCRLAVLRLSGPISAGQCPRTSHTSS